MEKKNYKPNLKDTARRARIIANVKEFEKLKNVPNSERLKRGVDAPVQIPITPQGKHRGDSKNHAKWGALDVGIAHLPDDVQAEFIEFMVDKGHRVYDERDEISKDPDKQALGLRAGIVHIDDNVEEKVAEPEKNFVPDKKNKSEAYDQEFGASQDAGNPGTMNFDPLGGSSPGSGQNPSGGDRSGTQNTGGPNWAAMYAQAEAKRKKAEEEFKAYQDKVGDYETKYKRLDELESLPFAEQRSQLVRLAAQAKGLAPSQAEQAMKKTQSDMLQQNIGYLKSQKRGAGGMKQFFRTAEKMGTFGQQQAALMKLKEKAMAEQGLGGSISEMTGQALKDKWTSMGLDVQTEIAKIQAEAAKYGAQLQAQAARAQAQGSMIGGLLGGLGTIAGFAMFGGSDKNIKKKIKREDLYKNEYGDSYPGYESEEGDSKIHKPVNVTPQDLLKKKTKRKKAVKYEKGEPKDFSPQKFLDALKPNSFEYKDEFKKNPMGGEGRFLGIMAQDLEKAGPVGKSMVEDTPMGKLVNYGKGFGAVLAAQAH